MTIVTLRPKTGILMVITNRTQQNHTTHGIHVNHSGIDIQEFKATLLALRDELASIEQAESDAKRPLELDQSRVGRLSRMDALQVQAMSVESFRRKKLQRQRVEAALTRIAKDEFGLCLECGEEINPKRLEFDPTFLVCIDCAEAREQ